MEGQNFESQGVHPSNEKNHEFEIETKKIFTRCLNLHDDFNRYKWGGRNSFHDADHLKAVLNAGTLLIDKAFTENNPNDPLNIRGDLEKWNRSHPSALVTEGEFREIFKIFVGCHDLGQILYDLSIDEHGNLKPNFQEIYTSRNHEQRSIEIANTIINQHFPDKNQREKILLLVNHLISMSIFYPQGIKDKDQPFSTFVQVVDQIGNSFFNDKKEESIWGLVEEMLMQGVQIDNIDNFFNFVLSRFPILVPNESIRQQILAIWEKQLPSKKEITDDYKKRLKEIKKMTK